MPQNEQDHEDVILAKRVARIIGRVLIAWAEGALTRAVVGARVTPQPEQEYGAGGQDAMKAAARPPRADNRVGGDVPQRDPQVPAQQENNGAVSCPVCGGKVWDNRATKRNPRAPDFKCRDRGCDGVIWPPKDENPGANRKGPSAQPARVGPPSSDEIIRELEDEDDDLPF